MLLAELFNKLIFIYLFYFNHFTGFHEVFYYGFFLLCKSLHMPPRSEPHSHTHTHCRYFVMLSDFGRAFFFVRDLG